MCRRCVVTPLLSIRGEVVSYFCEHRGNRGRSLLCTIGNLDLAPPGALSERRKKRLARKYQNNRPEMAGEIPSDVSVRTSSSADGDHLTVDPFLSSLHCEEDLVQPPVDMTHASVTTGSQLKEVHEALKKTYPVKLVNSTSRCLEQLVLLCIGLQYDQSYEAIVTRCISFLSGITQDGLVMTIKDHLFSYLGEINLSSMTGRNVAESYMAEKAVNIPENMSPDGTKVWEALKSGIFTQHLSYILGVVFAFSTCKIKNVKFDHPIYSAILKQSKIEEIDAVDVIDHATKLYNWTTTVGLACMEQRSLTPMLYNSDSLAKCQNRFIHWSKRFADFKRGDESTMEERQLMFVEVEEIHRVLLALSNIKRDKFCTLQASSLCSQVLTLYNNVRDFVCKIDYVKVAFAVHLHGPPKVGKSVLTNVLHPTICLADNQQYRKEDTAQLNLLAAFQDELNNRTQCITINESMPIKEHLAKSVETAFNTSLSLVDSVPYHPNRSSLEEKASITMQHISVVSNGNNEQPFINVCRTPGAWERRYISVKVNVKKEYSDAHGRFDSSKVDGSDNYHEIDVYEIIYEDGKKHVSYYTFQGKKSLKLDTHEFLELIRFLAMKHFASEAEREKRFQALPVLGCLGCQRLQSLCRCDSSLVTIQEVKQEHCDAVSCPANPCPDRTRVGHYQSPCVYKGGVCEYCQSEEFSSAQPEMSVTHGIVSTFASYVWEASLSWMNPFIKAKYLWSIDNNTMKIFHEEIIEELEYWPDAVGCTTLSLVPAWLEFHSDGSPTLFGKYKDRFLRSLAAEKQIFLPLQILLRRAIIWGILVFICVLCLQFAHESTRLHIQKYYYDMPYSILFGKNLREVEYVEFREAVSQKWEEVPLFPEFTPEAFKRRSDEAYYGFSSDFDENWFNSIPRVRKIQKFLGTLTGRFLTRKIFMKKYLVQTTLPWWYIPSIFASIFSVCFFLNMWLRRALGYHQRYEDLKRRASSDRDLQTQLYNKARRHTSEFNTLMPTAVGVLGVVVTGLVVWNKIRARPETEIDRSKPTAWNEFFNFTRLVPKPFQSKNHSDGQEVSVVRKNLVKLIASVDGKERKTNAIFIERGILLIPRHFFKRDPYKEEMLPELMITINQGSNRLVKVDTESLVRIGIKDFVLLSVAKSAPMRNIAYLLPSNTGTDNHRCVVVTRDSVENVSAKYIPEVDCAGFKVGRGLQYNSSTTNVGSCGTPIIADRKDGCILGFHIAGNIGIGCRVGFACEILHSDYISALEVLRTNVSTTNFPEHRDVLAPRFGFTFVKRPGHHPKSQMFAPGFMKDTHGLEILGHDPDLVKYRTRVQKTMISDSLTEFCGVPNTWKAPDMSRPWQHHNRAIIQVADGAFDTPHAAMEWAFADYFDPILRKLPDHVRAHPHLCRVLTDYEMVNGIEDSYYMRRLPMDTSVGPPFMGSKIDSDLFVEIEPLENGKKQYAITKLAENAFKDMIKCFENKQRYGVWVRTCLKDEVVSEVSEKCRIFYIMEACFTLAVRKYFLPIIEFICRNPLLCEMAVGINCAGPEWEALCQYVEEYAVDGMLVDYDHKSYDLKRSPNAAIASMRGMILIARTMGYTPEEMVIMHGITEELRNPIINWNGTILDMFLWPSGNSLTVFGNGLENVLMQRCAYYTNGVKDRGLIEFLKLGTYRDNIHTTSYGDDGKYGPHPRVRSFTSFSKLKEYFESVNMTITDAAKSDQPREFTPCEEIDFLKRKSVYHPKLGLRVGALLQSSIWKMGHMSTSREDPESVSVSSMTSMLMEGFLHGEEFYETLRAGLSKVAKTHFLWSDQFEMTYDERVSDWKDKYGS